MAFVSMNELLYLFHLCQGKPLTRGNHPIVFDRVVLFNHYFMKALETHKELSNILSLLKTDVNTINKINYNIIAIFIKKYNLESLFDSNSIIELQKEYDTFFQKIDIKKYAIKTSRK